MTPSTDLVLPFFAAVDCVGTVVGREMLLDVGATVAVDAFDSALIALA